MRFDGGDGSDFLKFDYSALSTSISFIVQSGSIVSSFGQFQSIETFQIAAGAGNDVIHTGDGNDSISTGAGSDDVYTGGGNDSVYSETGGDSIDMGTGHDFWNGNFASSTEALVVDLASKITMSNGVTVDNAESITLGTGSGNDRVALNRGGSGMIYAGEGEDTLTSSADQMQQSILVYTTATGGLYGGVNEVGFTDFERVELHGGSADDDFEITGLFAPAQILFDGGAGNDTLKAHFASLGGASSFIVQSDGTIVSNRGQFSAFETFFLDGGSSGDAFTTGGGNDVQVGGGGNDLLSGGAGSDVLAGGTDNDQLSGGSENDYLYGEDGNDTLIGGHGDDTLAGGAGQNEISGGAGNDSIESTGSHDLIGGDGGDDTIVLTGLIGGTIDGGGGIDTLIFGRILYPAVDAQFDSSSGSGSFVNIELVGGWIAGGGGDDVLDLSTLSATGTLQINAFEGDDQVIGGSETDLISGWAGNDTLSGGGGDDQLVDDVGNDLLDGGDGNDRAEGGSGTNTLVGGDGADTLVSAGYQDTIYGDADADLFLIFGVLDDSIDGGDGVDSLVFGNDLFFAPSTFNGTSGSATFENIEMVSGSLIGTSGNDVLDLTSLAASGSLSIFGDEGNDIVMGGSEADSVNGGLGADAMAGGLGDDTYVVDNIGDVVTEKDGEGTDTVQTSLGTGADLAERQANAHVLGANVENLFGALDTGQGLIGNAAANILAGAGGTDYIEGGVGNDSLYGGYGDDHLLGGTENDLIKGDYGFDSIEGGDGDDELRGNFNADTIFGGEGNDSIFGGNGHDQLFGGNGNDTIVGALGHDSLTGGAGNDVFVYQVYQETTAGGQLDKILDFIAGEDRIDLTQLDANVTTAANDAFTFIGAAAFSGVAGQLRAYDSGAGSWLVAGDVDGNGSGDFRFEVFSNAQFTSTDFFL